LNFSGTTAAVAYKGGLDAKEDVDCESRGGWGPRVISHIDAA